MSQCEYALVAWLLIFDWMLVVNAVVVLLVFQAVGLENQDD